MEQYRSAIAGWRVEQYKRIDCPAPAVVVVSHCRPSRCIGCTGGRELTVGA